MEHRVDSGATGMRRGALALRIGPEEGGSASKIEPVKKNELQRKAPDLVRDYKFFVRIFVACTIISPDFVLGNLEFYGFWTRAYRRNKLNSTAFIFLIKKYFKIK
ncbi:MAG: hypothetical protein RBR29_07765 [Castellaniella sp.]|uniref:hypothetical protein n=1 Tax=Castellaniella sp. TaxID=1955812 RepID=UPI002A36D426|nr:hypothetical protein [Castellaniella sp.]MDY0309670.1 hypothetical protein [Castellaniella sp.]